MKFSSGLSKGKYHTKTPLSRNGAIFIKCKVTSRYGESIEYGNSTSLDVKTGITFLLSNAVTQCRFGHINKFTGGWQNYYSSSDAIKGDDDINITVIDYNFAYDSFKDEYKFKQIKVNGKKYLQTFRKSNGKYKFDSRTKTTYTRTKKIQKINKEFKL